MFNVERYLKIVNRIRDTTFCFHHFNTLPALAGCWSMVFIRRTIFKCLNVCPLNYTACVFSGKVGIP